MRYRKLFTALLLFLFYFTITVHGINTPEISAKSAIAVDIDTGEIIFAKNIDNRAYPASITKLMTALLFLENKSPAEMLTYTQSAKAQPEYSLNINFSPIEVGDKISAKDALNSLLLYSANDIAYMIADNVFDTTDKFIQLMNDKAKYLNMNNTHFTNPNGLHNENHYSTAYDLTLLGRAALSNSLISEISGRKEDKITLPNGSEFNITNRNNLLGKDGCIAGKTGFTTPAGKCLLALYNRNERRIIGVVLNSEFDPEDKIVCSDMEKIINYSYSLESTILYRNMDIIYNKELKYKPFFIFGEEKTISVPLIIKDFVSYYDNDLNKRELRIEYNVSDLNLWNLDSNSPVGTVLIRQRENYKVFNLYPAITTKDILKSNADLYLLAFAAFNLPLLFIAYIITYKAKKRRYRDI